MADIDRAQTSCHAAWILLLVLIAVLVVFRPAAPLVGMLPVDRDQERLIADLQAHPEAPADIHLRLRQPYPFV